MNVPGCNDDDTYSPLGLVNVNSAMDFGDGAMSKLDVAVYFLDSVATCLYDAFTECLVSDTGPAAFASLHSAKAMIAHNGRLHKAKCMAQKAGKMELVEKALPQAQFAKSVGLSVSNRREAAEVKFLAQIARRR